LRQPHFNTQKEAVDDDATESLQIDQPRWFFEEEKRA
jgi:hypothetical protein